MRGAVVLIRWSLGRDLVLSTEDGVCVLVG
jgi:hypothetical protein